MSRLCTCFFSVIIRVVHLGTTVDRAPVPVHPEEIGDPRLRPNEALLVTLEAQSVNALCSLEANIASS